MILHSPLSQSNLRQLENWLKLTSCCYKAAPIFQSTPKLQTSQYFTVCNITHHGLNVHKAMFYCDKVEDANFMCGLWFSLRRLWRSLYTLTWCCVAVCLMFPNNLMFVSSQQKKEKLQAGGSYENLINAFIWKDGNLQTNHSTSSDWSSVYADRRQPLCF